MLYDKNTTVLKKAIPAFDQPRYFSDMLRRCTDLCGAFCLTQLLQKPDF